MRRTTKRFELEQSTLEADGQRVIALRADVTELESRLHELEEAGPSVNEASRKVDEMSARLTSLSGELGRIGEQMELVEGMREGMSEAQRMAVDVAASLSKLEARQSDVQDSMNDLQTLRGTGGEVAEALESLRAARSEIERSQTGQAETGAWLAGTHESIQELRTKVAQLDDLTTNIDHMRENALLREIRASLESLTSQRAVIDQVIATSGRLSVEAREAEGLLDVLREERELTQGIHDALKELRREESETVHVDFGKKGA
jgi:chromosome segregation ATPase